MMMSTYSLGMAWSGSGTQRILLMVAIGEWSVHDDDHHHHYEDDFDDYGVDLSIIKKGRVVIIFKKRLALNVST